MTQILAKGNIQDIKEKIEDLLEIEFDPKVRIRYKELLKNISKWKRGFGKKGFNGEEIIDIEECKTCQYVLLTSLEKIVEIQTVGGNACGTCADTNYVAWAVAEQFPKTAHKVYTDLAQTKTIINIRDQMNDLLFNKREQINNGVNVNSKKIKKKR